LTVTAPKGFTFRKPVFPKALRKKFGFTSGTIPVYEGTFTVKVAGHLSPSVKPGSATINAVLSTQACKGGQCFPPEDAKISTKITIKAGAITTGSHARRASLSDDETAAAGLAGMNTAKRFLMLYLGGLLLALTPCVYPMIPVTVGYFSSQGEKHKGKVITLAAAYVLGLAVTYAILGTVAALTGGALGSALQSSAVIVGIATLLVVLSLSMFGLYELRVPQCILSKSSGRGGIAGALFMGLIFGVVAAPCAGPFVLGLTLFAAKTGSPLAGFIMFFVLAVGMGTPLFLLAAFSAKLPVPGKWMLVAERLGGFALLGAAAYFVEPIVPAAVRPYLIPAVILAAGIYVGCVENTVQSSKLAAAIGKVFCVGALAATTVMVWPSAKHPSIQWQPFKAESVKLAAQSGKPFVVDFSAEWCAACKELQKGPFSDPRVIAAAKDFSAFRVDGTRRTPEVTAAERQLGVSGKGYPIVLFFDTHGHEVRSARIIGFVDPNEVIRRIEMIR
jgi:thiol:disulfide interchange protein DsbD